MARDWIPKGYEDLNRMVNLTLTYIMAPGNISKLGLTGTAVWIETEVLPAASAFNSILAVWKDPATRTPLIVRTVQDARSALVPLYRQLYSGLLRGNPMVSEVDLTAMGLWRHRDRTLTAAPVARSYPVIEARPAAPAVVEFHYRDSETGKRGKPKRTQGAAFRLGFVDAAQQDWETLPLQMFCTVTPLRVTFTGEQRGKCLRFTARWQNTRGEWGPTGEIRSVIVP